MKYAVDWGKNLRTHGDLPGDHAVFINTLPGYRHHIPILNEQTTLKRMKADCDPKRAFPGLTRAARKGLTCLLLVLAGMMPGLNAFAEERVALIIGNSSYQTVAPLDNPRADANLVAERLEDLGFTVTLLIDASLADMKKGVATFGRRLRAGGKETTGLFYYAGHGVQSFGFNYLLPVDTELTDAADLDLVAVEASSVLRQMFSAQNRNNIVILDACRDNPFESIPDFNDNGLAEMKAPTGTFLAYATAPGNVALDGQNGNSPFTAALAEEMLVQGAPIEQVFKQVRVRVLEETNGMQTPWDTSSLTQQFYFVEPEVIDPEVEAARQLWAAAKASGDMIQVMLYLRLHPDSPFEGEARELLAKMVDDLGGGDGAAADVGGDSDAVKVAAAPAATPTPEPAAATRAPAADEQTLIGKAQGSGELADYEAYLAAYPAGVFSELAKIEVDAIRKKQTEDPEGGREPAQPEPAPTPAETQTASLAPAGEISFLAPITAPGSEIHGKSIEQLAQGSPLFPPIEGLPEDYWKGQDCSNCHQWTKDALCTQARTYLSANASRSLGKEHPYGGGFKQVLKAWAAGDCQ